MHCMIEDEGGREKVNKEAEEEEREREREGGGIFKGYFVRVIYLGHVLISPLIHPSPSRLVKS